MRQMATTGLLAVGLGLTFPGSDALARGRRDDRPRRSDIRRAMKPVIPRVQRCAKSARVQASIRAVVELRGSNGRVKGVVLKGQRLPRGVARCVRRVIRSARFKRFRNATFRFTWPFLFQPGSSKSGTARKTGRSGLPEKLSMVQIRAGIQPVELGVYRCNKARRVRATYKVRIKVRGATGHVYSVHFLRSGLPKGLQSCIRRAYLAGRFPRFRRASQTFIHNKRLQ